jgi:protein-S-isoprenylcysteine O-methyltransferase Ste14
MPLSFPQLFAAIWLAWLAYWAISARNVKPVQRREPLASRMAHILPLTVAAALLLGSPEPPIPWLSQRWLPASAARASAGAAITIVGLGLTAWARTTLGTNWSGTVTVKRDHELVVAGPYRHVRHPIYSGLLLAFAGSALARGDWRGLLALLIAWLSLWRKWHVEERFMRETFGQAYSDYAARTPAVIPRLF